MQGALEDEDEGPDKLQGDAGLLGTERCRHPQAALLLGRAATILGTSGLPSVLYDLSPMPCTAHLGFKVDFWQQSNLDVLQNNYCSSRHTFLRTVGKGRAPLAAGWKLAVLVIFGRGKVG